MLVSGFNLVSYEGHLGDLSEECIQVVKVHLLDSVSYKGCVLRLKINCYVLEVDEPLPVLSGDLRICLDTIRLAGLCRLHLEHLGHHRLHRLEGHVARIDRHILRSQAVHNVTELENVLLSHGLSIRCSEGEVCGEGVTRGRIHCEGEEVRVTMRSILAASSSLFLGSCLTHNNANLIDIVCLQVP